MRKLLIGLVLVALFPIAAVGVLLASGTIDSSSVRMMLNVMTGLGGPAANPATVEDRYQVPKGFTLELYAADLPRVRFMRFTPSGDLLASRPHAGDILLLRRDDNGDGRPDAVETLLEGLQRPLGLDLRGEWLYVAESNRVGRVPYDDRAGGVTGDYEVVIDGLTDNGNHWSKTIGFGPDGQLYLAQGSTCNVCEEADPRRATLMRFTPDGNDGKIIATGLRNSVGFDWAPWSGELYATDNGRDLLGDGYPSCELNRIETGMFYGWPYYNDNNDPDPDMGADPLFGERTPTAPVHGFRAHNAPLGIHFPDTRGWPADFRRSALVALHGSWNRSEPDGYKVVSLHWDDAGNIEERDFLAGFNREGDITGRPVDVAQGPDGAVYISDDYAGAIYRVSYGKGKGAGNGMPMNLSDRVDVKQPPEWLADANLDELAETGQALYEANGCAECHENGDNPKVLTGLNQRLDYPGVMEALVAPQSPMPVYPLDQRELRALAVYLLR